MIRTRKFFLLLSLIGVLGVGLGIQTYEVYRLNHKLSALETDSGSATAQLQAGAANSGSVGASNPWGPATSGIVDPFANMQNMRQQMDALFGSMLPGNSLSSSNRFYRTTSPAIELEETDSDYQITISVPEEGELELSTEVEDNTVRLSGTIQYKPLNEGNSAMLFSSRSQFSRSIPLRESVDPLAMQTRQTEDGLVISIPKA